MMAGLSLHRYSIIVLLYYCIDTTVQHAKVLLGLLSLNVQEGVIYEPFIRVLLRLVSSLVSSRSAPWKVFALNV